MVETEFSSIDAPDVKDVSRVEDETRSLEDRRETSCEAAIETSFAVVSAVPPGTDTFTEELD